MGDQDWGSGGVTASNGNGDEWGVSNGDTQPANGHNGFDTSDAQADNGDNNAGDEAAPPPPVQQIVPPRLEGWVQAIPYDYTDAQNNEWESSARVYEWDGEEGEVAPEHPELELQLFGDPDKREHHGIDFTR